MQSPGAPPVDTGEILEPTETRTETSQDDVSLVTRSAPPPLTVSRSRSESENDDEKLLSSPVKRTPSANEIRDTVFFCLNKNNSIRAECIKIAQSSNFEGVVITIIAANCLALCLYVPSDPPDSNRNKLLDLLDFIFTICFTVELVLKLICYGLRDYLKDSWHWLDVVVVAAGYTSVLVGSASENLSPIKIFRILRPLRTITMFPGLRMLVNTVISCVPMVFNVVLLCIYFLLVMGILGNQLFSGQLSNRCVLQQFNEETAQYEDAVDPVTGKKVVLIRELTGIVQTCAKSTSFTLGWPGFICPEKYSCTQVENPNYGITNFDNLAWSFLTIFQCITLEQWVDIMYWTQDATMGWACLYFIVVIFIGAFFLLNLVLAVITSMHNDTIAVAKEEQKKGLSAPTPNVEVVAMSSMMQKFMDTAGEMSKDVMNRVGGEVASRGEELAASVWQRTRLNIRLIIMSFWFNPVVTFLILLNTLVLSLEYEGMDPQFRNILELLNFILSVIFLFEMSLKIGGLGFKEYIADGYNKFDMLVNLVNLCEMSLYQGQSGSLSVLRAFRILRVMKLFGNLKTLQLFLGTLMKTVMELGNFTFVVFLVIFIFALLGMQLFGDKIRNDEGIVPRSNFDSLLWSTITVFQILTGEDWNQVMYDAMNSVGNWAVVFFLALVIMGNYVVVNLFIAILLTSFEEHREDLKREALEMMVAKRKEMKTLQSIVWSVRSSKQKHSPASELHENQPTKKSRSFASVFLASVLASHKLREKRDGKSCENSGTDQSISLPTTPRQQSDEIDTFQQLGARGRPAAMSVPDISALTRGQVGSLNALIGRNAWRDGWNKDVPQGGSTAVSSAGEQGVLWQTWHEPSSDASGEAIRLSNSARDGFGVNNEDSQAESAAEENGESGGMPGHSKLSAHPLPGSERSSLESESPCLSEGHGDVARRGVHGSSAWNWDPSLGGHRAAWGKIPSHSLPDAQMMKGVEKGDEDIEGLIVGAELNKMRLGTDSCEPGRGLEVRSPEGHHWEMNPLSRSSSFTSSHAPDRNSNDGHIHTITMLEGPTSSPAADDSVAVDTAGDKSDECWRCVGDSAGVTRQHTDGDHDKEGADKDEHTAGSPGSLGSGNKYNSPLFSSPKRGMIKSPSSNSLSSDRSDTGSQEGHLASCCLHEVLREMVSGKDGSDEDQEYDEKALGLFTLTNPIRRTAMHITSLPHFDTVIISFICINTVVLAVECPALEDDKVAMQLFYVSDFFFTMLFLIEALLKIVSKGFCVHPNSYLRSGWNVLDFIIVLTSTIILMLESVLSEDVLEATSSIRVLRIFRVLRPLRMINRVPELKVVVEALLASFPGLGSVLAVTMLFLLIFGILGMNLFSGKFMRCTDPHPSITKATCTGLWDSDGDGELDAERVWYNPDKNFDNLYNAGSTLFQMLTTEGWLEVLESGVDVVGRDKNPRRNHNQANAAYFLVFMTLGSFFLVNLFVGIVLDNFELKRKELGTPLFTTRNQQLWLQARRKLFQVEPVKQLSSTRTHKEFFQELVKSRHFELTVAALIILNVALLSAQHEDQPQYFTDFSEDADLAFTVIFLAEMVFKLACMGVREYWRTNWNRLDALIVITSVVGLFLDDTSFGTARIFRVLRITRILRLIQSMKPLRLMIDTLMKALPTVMNVGGMTVLYFFVFAVLGVSQFGKVNQHQVCLDEHANFSNFGYAMVTLVRMVTGEAWNCIMYDAMVQEPNCDDENNPNNDYGCGSLWAPLYFFAFIIGGNFIMINLFLAIVLENYNNARKKDAEEITAHDIIMFQELWNKYDREGTGLLHTSNFEDFVRKVEPPLGLPRNSFGHIKRSDLYKLNVPLIGEYVHYHDVLQALSCQAYDVNFEDLNEKVQRNVLKELRGHRKKSVVKLQERHDDNGGPRSDVVPAEGPVTFRIPSTQILGELVWGQPFQARAPVQARDNSPPKQTVPVVDEGRESGTNQEPDPEVENYTSGHVIATSFLQHSVREFLFRKRLVKYIQLQMLQDELEETQKLSKTLLDILYQKQLKTDEETVENADVQLELLRSRSSSHGTLETSRAQIRRSSSSIEPGGMKILGYLSGEAGKLRDMMPGRLPKYVKSKPKQPR